MWDFSIARAIGLMVRTAPFIALRLVIYFGITLAYIIATGGGAAIGYGLGHISDDPSSYGVFGGLAGFVVVSVAVYWVREYILYIVKAGHIAVLVKLIEGEDLPAGQSQIDYAKAEVTARFGEANALFALDQIVKAVVGTITGLLGGVAAIIPLPGLDGLVRFVNAVVRMALTYVDELILAYNIRTGTANGDKYLPEVRNQVFDRNGTVVASVVRTLYIRLKPAFRPASSHATTADTDND